MCDPASVTAAIGGKSDTGRMIGATAIGGSIGMNAYAAYSGAKAERQQAYFEASIAESNAALADAAAVDAIERGGMAVNEARRSGRKLIGQQRAAAAAGGIQVDAGIAEQLQKETEFLTEQDVATIRTNAARSAWGSRTEATNYRASAAMQRAVGKSKSPGRAAGMSLLSDASQVASRFAFG